MPDLTEYRRRRDASRTPEPVPDEADPWPGRAKSRGTTFVIQEHHASQLHWDMRLERDGVLVSWAVPKGMPVEPDIARLAVRVEDYPLEYADFSGVIPAGQYGAGRTEIWDRGRYDTVHWDGGRIEIVLRGSRLRGTYEFLHTAEDDDRHWRVRRLDEAEEGWQSLPLFVPPMTPGRTRMPGVSEDGEWSYEFAWDGLRAQVRVQGGRIGVRDGDGRDRSATYPELRGIGARLGSVEALLDGVIVVLADGRPSAVALHRRANVTTAADLRRMVRQWPAVYLAFDLLHLAGSSCLALPYRRRRELLAGLGLAGDHWRVPECYEGEGAAVLEASRVNGLGGVVAKRLDSPYRPGRPSQDWAAVRGVRVQEVVVGGWRPGGGSRAETVGSLLLGVPADEGLRYVGNVGSGFTREDLNELVKTLPGLGDPISPFADVPADKAREARWVRPELVGEVVFRGWTDARCLRAPSWRGLRGDLAPDEVGFRG
ncbi:DNA polymerase ligase N-terminal domain-containing protein [Amycolatopsis minnesotensis]|uniref:DNA ligase (ATP) n=1 Tax=Amycolatopsis minnesotensis TaxID=337894 RepID=A0ABN2RL19_9PSEU